MDFVSLYYFSELAKDLNMTKTANRLYISQQTLSNHIQRLESYYGTPLFVRKPALSAPSHRISGAASGILRTFLLTSTDRSAAFCASAPVQCGAISSSPTSFRIFSGGTRRWSAAMWRA